MWWAALGEPMGSGPGRRRPVLVVQSDPFNDSRIGTVVVAAITSNLRLAEAPGNVALDEGDAGLPKPSVVNVSQIATVDRRALDALCGSLGLSGMAAVDDGIRLVMGV